MLKETPACEFYYKKRLKRWLEWPTNFNLEKLLSDQHLKNNEWISDLFIMNVCDLDYKIALVTNCIPNSTSNFTDQFNKPVNSYSS